MPYYVLKSSAYQKWSRGQSPVFRKMANGLWLVCLMLKVPLKQIPKLLFNNQNVYLEASDHDKARIPAMRMPIKIHPSLSLKIKHGSTYTTSNSQNLPWQNI